MKMANLATGQRQLGIGIGIVLLGCATFAGLVAFTLLYKPTTYMENWIVYLDGKDFYVKFGLILASFGLWITGLAQMSFALRKKEAYVAKCNHRKDVTNDEIQTFFDTLQDNELSLVNINPKQIKGARYVTAKRDQSGNVIGIAGICLMRYIRLPYLFVVVKKPYWNQGIGTMLVRDTLKYAIARYHYFTLSTHNDPEHQSAIHIYKKCGFIYLLTTGKEYWMVAFGERKF